MSHAIKKIPPPHFSLLPEQFKVDYCLVTEKAKTDWITYLLWEGITPGWTAVFLILTGIWYYFKGLTARSHGDHSKQRALHDARNAFFFWGLLNCFLYLLLAIQQRR